MKNVTVNVDQVDCRGVHAIQTQGCKMLKKIAALL
jgi:hypothetical protein